MEKTFGKKRVKVKATIGGEPYRGSLVRMGTACHLLPVLKEIRARIGKTIGDAVEVELEEDTGDTWCIFRMTSRRRWQQILKPNRFIQHYRTRTRKKLYVGSKRRNGKSTRQGRIERAIERLKQGKRGI